MRVKVDIPAQVTSASAATSVFLVNLSVSGALIESPKQLTDGDAQVGCRST
jgi:hypothetical protein